MASGWWLVGIKKRESAGEKAKKTKKENRRGKGEVIGPDGIGIYARLTGSDGL